MRHHRVHLNNRLQLPHERDTEGGKAGWALAWLLGVPLPLLLVIYLFTRAC
jgi:hypothetical protein